VRLLWQRGDQTTKHTKLVSPQDHPRRLEEAGHLETINFDIRHGCWSFLCLASVNAVRQEIGVGSMYCRRIYARHVLPETVTGVTVEPAHKS
jgi:hypothetical protein